MTDKQIIERLKTDLDFERSKRKSLQAELKTKEQECEELKKQIKIIDDETIVVEITEKQFEEYQKLKAENEKLKIYKSITPLKVKKLLQTLTEIKEILNFYANSKIGEQQENGTYRVRLDEQYSTSYAYVPYFEYDPRPAKQALRKISEVEDV